MKIAILETDHVAPPFVEVHGSYPDMFKALLLAVDPTIAFEVFTVVDGEFPQSMNYDAFLITGSQFSAYEDIPWITELKALINEIFEHKIPLIGICFGHQVIAMALGGSTKKAEQGWGLGVSTSQLYEKQPWMDNSVIATFNLLVSHQDQVVELPKGATLVAGNDFCPNAMYQIDNRVLTFQGHPEFTKEYCLALMNKRRAIVGEQVYQKALASLDQPENGHLIAQWIVAFIQQYQCADG